MRRRAWSISRLSSTLPAWLGTWGVLGLLVVGGFVAAYRYLYHLRLHIGLLQERLKAPNSPASAAVTRTSS